MLTGAAIVAERPLGAVRAVKRSIALTRGNGLVLAALIALVTFAAELVAQIFVGAGALMASANAVNPIAMAVVDGLAAAVQSGAAVLLVLIQVEFYRRLSAKYGICGAASRGSTPSARRTAPASIVRRIGENPLARWKQSAAGWASV